MEDTDQFTHIEVILPEKAKLESKQLYRCQTCLRESKSFDVDYSYFLEMSEKNQFEQLHLKC